MTVSPLTPRSGILVAEVGADQAEIACAVMHRAFAEYLARGAESGATRETPESLRRELAAGIRLALATQDRAAVGMVKFVPDEASGTLYFSRLSVVPEHRGQSVASALLGWLRGRAEGAGLRGLSCSVRATEARNRAIYEHLGMVVVGRSSHVSLTGAWIDSLRMTEPASCARSAS